MRITLSSIHVDDQEEALTFYRDVLGFQKKQDLQAGESRWLSVVSPEAPDGPELVLEPNEHPAAREYQQALYRDGIPLTSLEVDDIEAEVERLKDNGVEFSIDPTDHGHVIIAVFDDTCGNYIQLHEQAD